MKQEPKKQLSYTRILNRTADYLEILVSIVLIIVIVLTLIDLILDILKDPLISSEHYFNFNYFFARMLNLIIGLEFTRMLCRHSPDTIIEVLLFAVARNLLAEEPTAISMFFGSLSIGVLFFLRKYMLPNTGGDKSKYNYKSIFRRGSCAGEDKPLKAPVLKSAESEGAE